MDDVTPAPEEWRPVVGFEGEYEVTEQAWRPEFGPHAC